MNASPICTQAANTASNSVPETWGLFSPAARMVKNSAQLLHSTLLGTQNLSHFSASNAQEEEKKRLLVLRLKNATSAEEWRATARELDVMENNEAWKFDNQSDEFDAPLIEMKLKQLNDARKSGDIKQMLNLIRTSLSRDLGGIGNTQLYTHSYIGTKDLIENYINSALAMIRTLVEVTKNELPPDVDMGTILDQVLCARQAFGRSALLLSGGGTFGMNHIGVLKAIFDVKSLPRIISGSSAGSIVSSILCTLTDAEIPGVLASFAHESNLAVFEDSNNPDSILTRLHRLLTKGAWIDNKFLVEVMQNMIGDMTFQEAYNRTRRILNICVSSASVYELPRILNYITAPNVMIWSAVAASCSVPMIFAASSLLIKDPITDEYAPWNPTPQQWIDGSVEGDVPMTRIAEMFNVNHFIVSQVNPHVIPFLADEHRANPKPLLDPVPGWISTITQLAKDEALHRLRMLAEVGILSNAATKMSSVLSQKYSGHITILPQVGWKDIPLILTNPTPEFMEKALLYGERATWPKLSMIRNSCAVELELDSAVQEIRARLVFGDANQISPRNHLTLKHSRPLMRVKARRGYTITTNADLEEIMGSDTDDDIYGTAIEKPGKKSPLKIKIVPPFLKIQAIKNTPADLDERKFQVPYTSTYPPTEFSDSSYYSPQTSDDERDSYGSPSEADYESTAFSSPLMTDSPQLDTPKVDFLLAKLPTLSIDTSFSEFAAAIECPSTPQALVANALALIPIGLHST
ncbi:Triacylglycerol lipase 4 [Podosphaera aphanis]|nr:Triacylglycerol lipase 4 [Podosphaera aphanis]